MRTQKDRRVCQGGTLLEVVQGAECRSVCRNQVHKNTQKGVVWKNVGEASLTSNLAHGERRQGVGSGFSLWLWN